ncbi:MAG: uracil-DNA glycosylase [Bacteroidaceae bacterium]|nr:uracil-DNA glycosylase [Bacteroidaceae bacterium]
MQVKIEPSWAEHLASEFSAPYFNTLTQFVRQEYSQHTCYPPGTHIFRAFDLCPFDKVKVVIIGQDPYHEPGQAEGLCFSVAEGVPFPPSLRNIFQEVVSDQGVSMPTSGSLIRWAEQGVLLLNATLTVRAHQAGSHQGKGWEQFTDAAIAKLAAEREHLVFLLWGSYAQKKSELIDASRHLILKSPHPSPLSAYRGFFGNHHFTLANDYLKKWGIQEIKW